VDNIIAVYGTLRKGQRANPILKGGFIGSACVDRRCFGYCDEVASEGTFPDFQNEKVNTFIMAAPVHGRFPAIVSVNNSWVNEWESRNKRRYVFSLEFYRVDNDTLRSVDRYEGYPYLYIKGIVYLPHNDLVDFDNEETEQSMRGIRVATVYIMNVNEEHSSSMHFLPSGDWLDYDGKKESLIASIEKEYTRQETPYE